MFINRDKLHAFDRLFFHIYDFYQRVLVQIQLFYLTLFYLTLLYNNTLYNFGFLVIYQIIYYLRLFLQQRQILALYSKFYKEEHTKLYNRFNRIKINKITAMLQYKANEQKKSKQLFQQSQKDYTQFLLSLLPASFVQSDNKDYYKQQKYKASFRNLGFFQTKSNQSFNKSYTSLSKSRTNLDHQKAQLTLGQFFIKFIKKVSSFKYVQQYGQLQPICKQLGIDIKNLNKTQGEESKKQYMIQSIDKSIQDLKKKVVFNSKSSIQSINLHHNSSYLNNKNVQKPTSFVDQLNKKSSKLNNHDASSFKQNNYLPNNQFVQKVPSLYEQFLRQQNKKQVDNFNWLDINTKYPMLQKKLKSKLIQSINQSNNQKRIRQLIQKKQNSKKSTLCNNFNDYNEINQLDDQKVQLVNESLFMEQFQKGKIDYVWTQNDEKLFISNIKQLKRKCLNKSQFLKLCGRFKFISQGEFQTLASQDISRAINTNNKIYLSRQFLLDKYFSTTQVLTQQQMRFILKTSPMLSKCVDKNFIKTAIKNIKYENISDLELKIAEDIISKFEKLRDTVRASRRVFKQKANQATKQRINKFQCKKQLQIARLIAKEELKQYKQHLFRTINYENRGSIHAAKTKGLSKKVTSNVWAPLNKFHPSTGLFVKDCNQQCTDDLFNNFQREYLLKIKQNKSMPKPNLKSRGQMMKFYTGGPDENVSTNFNVKRQDMKNLCAIIKGYYFQKKITAALQSIEVLSNQQNYKIQQPKTQVQIGSLKTKKCLSPEQDLEIIAKKKLLQNRQKAKQTVYANKLLFLAAQNAFQSLKALNPDFSPDQVNVRDKKNNTALFYACKHKNEQFAQYLMKFGANPNLKCQKEFTPLHLAFKSNNLQLILILLSSSFYAPNLNTLNSQFKTPLAYCCRQILLKLNLQKGVTDIDSQMGNQAFDNNQLLKKQEIDKIKQESLQIKNGFSRQVRQNQRKNEGSLSSIRSLRQ